MRKLLLSLLAVPLLIAGCTKGDNSCGPEDSNEIKLTAGVADANAVKAGPVYGPISSGFTVDFPIGIYAINSTVGWKAAPNEIENDQGTVLAAGVHDVTFASGPYFYPVNGDALTFFAFTPQSPVTTPAGLAISPKVTHAMTGQEDIMWCTASGYKLPSLPVVHPVLGFDHKLTQLQFTFKSGTAYPASGYKVISLLVKSQPTSAEMEVSTGNMVFSGSADMEALSTSARSVGIEITTSGTDALSPVMTRTIASYTLDIVVKPVSGANITYTNIPVTVSTVAGTAHMVTVTFNQTNVAATATVTNWLTGSGGSAIAQ